MKQRIIANPPIGIYTNPTTHIGHAFFLSLLDTIVRYKREFKNEKVIFPGRSYNFYGKRGDKMVSEETSDSELYNILNKRNLEIIKQDKNRLKLNLSSLDILVDNEQVIVEGVTRDLIKLYKKGYVYKEGNTLFLDCPKISKDFNLKSYLDKITFHPTRIQLELERLIERNMDLIPITKSTRYSPKNPIGGDNIGPLFVLSNMWNHKYKDSLFTMAGSNGVLSKYIFLRFLSHIVLYGDPGMNELIIWPKIIPEGGVESWNLDELVKDNYHGDMIRHAVLSAYSKKKQKLELSKSNWEGARNFVYLLVNLRKPLKGSFNNDEFNYEYYKKQMDSLNYQKVLVRIERNLREISREINSRRDSGRWGESSRSNLASRYMSLVKMCEPFVPETVKLIKGDMK